MEKFSNAFYQAEEEAYKIKDKIDGDKIRNLREAEMDYDHDATKAELEGVKKRLGNMELAYDGMIERSEQTEEELREADMIIADADQIIKESKQTIKETIEKNKKLSEESTVDALTGVKNKRFFNDYGLKLLQIESRQKGDCAMLMIDADYFKQVNDEFGHLAGDKVLKSLSEMIENNIRETDEVCRFGGEEFVVLLPGTNSAQAAVVAEKIRKTAEETIIEIVDNENKKHSISKTLSIGAVGTDQILKWGERLRPEEIENIFEDITRMMDSALYQAKNSGRNKVFIYDKTIKPKEEQPGN